MGSVRTGFFCVAFLGFFASRLGTDPFGIVRLANCVLDLGCLGVSLWQWGGSCKRGGCAGWVLGYNHGRNTEAIGQRNAR